MGWQLILIELLAGLMVFFVLASCGLFLGWLWMVMNEDLVERVREIRKFRGKWKE